MKNILIGIFIGCILTSVYAIVIHQPTYITKTEIVVQKTVCTHDKVNIEKIQAFCKIKKNKCIVTNNSGDVFITRHQ